MSSSDAVHIKEQTKAIEKWNKKIGLLTYAMIFLTCILVVENAILIFLFFK